MKAGRQDLRRHARSHIPRASDESPPSHWVYVGDYPTDPDTTHESPPFQNDVVNAGNGRQRLRFRVDIAWQLIVEGEVLIIGGIPDDGIVVTTIPEYYRRAESLHGPGTADDQSGRLFTDVVWRLDANGDLVLLPAFPSHTSAIGRVASDDGSVQITDPTGPTVDLSVTDETIATSDVTTNNVSTGKHGWTPKLPNDATKFLNGVGGYSAPFGTSPGGGGVQRLYDYTVTGSDKASIDSNVDGTTVASFAGFDILEVWLMLKTDAAGALDTADLTLNNDTGNNYDRIYIQGFSGSAGSGTSLAQTQWRFNAHGSGGTANYASTDVFTFPNYAGTTFYKTGEVRESVVDGTSGNNAVTVWALGYRSTSAITRVKIAGVSGAKFKVGSRMIVYGR